MRQFFMSFLVLAISILAFANHAQAKETDFIITVKSNDAKFIGTAAGGAHIMIRNRLTGDLIADGTTYGNTGDTALLMAEETKRDATLISDGSARFQFSLEFWEPLPVTITATAPMGQEQSKVSISQDMILIPGKDYTAGNGILLEIPGLSVNVSSPQPNSSFDHNPEVPVTLEANIMHLCGCKIEEDSPWPPARYLVEAHIYKEGLYIASFEMPYANEPGIYSQNIKIPLPGIYKLVVTAFDPVTKESGMDSTTVVLKETTKSE